MARVKKSGLLGRFNTYKKGVEVTVEPCEDAPPLREERTDSEKISCLWKTCEECGEDVWLDHVQKEFYHKLACSKSNGIGYGTERSKEPMIKHHVACDCLCCQKQ